MISHLLTKLPQPRLADWGRGMSVGIVVICDSRSGIVSVSDMKATFSDFSADHAALKGRRLYRNWWVAYAGDDVEYMPSILADASYALGQDADEPFKKAHEVVSALNDAYWNLMHAQIESRVLRKQKFTIDSFRETGSKKCTATVYNNLCAKIDKVEISLKFLVYGFDENEEAHIYLVDGRESPKCYDELGVWAVGSGAHAALSSLAFHIDRKELNKTTTSVEEAVYFACEAKFMAESSGYVGRDATIIAVHRATNSLGKSTVLYDQSDTSEIKDAWKKEGAPRVPSGVAEKIKVILEKSRSTRSDSETSEQAQ